MASSVDPKYRNATSELSSLEFRYGIEAKNAKLLKVVGKVIDVEFWKNHTDVTSKSHYKTDENGPWTISGIIPKASYLQIAMDDKVSSLKVCGIIKENDSEDCDVNAKVKELPRMDLLLGPIGPIGMQTTFEDYDDMWPIGMSHLVNRPEIFAPRGHFTKS